MMPPKLSTPAGVLRVSQNHHLKGDILAKMLLCCPTARKAMFRLKSEIAGHREIPRITAMILISAMSLLLSILRRLPRRRSGQKEKERRRRDVGKKCSLKLRTIVLHQ